MKEDEAATLESTAIAVNGIVVITNKANTIESLTLDQVRQIFTGEVTEWEEVQ
ncbi:substrate-binding domain-containing protein [Jeotgalibaca porci]|uniref:substrate-binding domain-containing protein n=1 Tax=Jeotgalibaca porci TaxID=1868793 RepID=UPI0035A06DB7